MAQYKVCKRCGAHLDYGERCNCEEDTHEQPELDTAHRPRARKRKSLAELNDLMVEQAWNEFDMR